MVVWMQEVMVVVVGGTMEILFGDPVLWGHVIDVLAIAIGGV